MASIFENRYKALRQRLDNEIIEPALGWGFRVAIAVMLPVILSIQTGNHDYFWMIVAAQAISIVELKGTAGMRSRLLIAAFSFALIFTIIGSIVGTIPLLAVLLLLPIALGVGLMKNLGDWGPALALNIYLFYLISSNYPTYSMPELVERIYFIGLGGIWAMAVGVFSFVFLPQGKPYRRTIGNIWTSIEQLTTLIANDWDTKAKRSSVRAIYLKEKEIRKAIDESQNQFNIRFGSKQNQNSTDKNLSYARRCAAMASLQIIGLIEPSNILFRDSVAPLFKTQMASLLKVLEQISNRMAYYLYTLKEEELVIIQSRLQRLNQFVEQLQTMPDASRKAAQELLIHINRFSRLVKLSIDTLNENKEHRIYSQYSFLQTLNILHPKYLVANFRQFINFDNLTLKYALRMSIAATLSYFLGNQFIPDHAYWMPLTTIIVTQPYFGATLKKGLERSIGTVVGVILGSALLAFSPYPMLTKYLLIFVGSILMIYNLRKNYAWAAFFITLFLIGLMAKDNVIEKIVIVERLIATIAGGAISILAGFLLFPDWDKKLLPKYLHNAVVANYQYFLHLFYESDESSQTWTQLKKVSETANSNAYDSLYRYISEPKYKAKNYAAAYFTAINYNIRITRELNFYQDETEANESIGTNVRSSIIPLLINIHQLFRQSIEYFEQKYNLPEAIDWKIEKHFKPDLQPNENQWQSIERLYIELKAMHAGLLH